MRHSVTGIQGVGQVIEWGITDRPGGQQEQTRAFFQAVRETLNSDNAVCVTFPTEQRSVIAQCAAHPIRLRFKQENMLLKTTRKGNQLFYWVEGVN